MTEAIRPHGPLTMDTVTQHINALDVLTGVDLITIDLSDVTETDSSAVALLLAWCRTAQDRRQRVSLVRVPDGLRSLIAVYGLTDLLPLAG